MRNSQDAIIVHKLIQHESIIRTVYNCKCMSISKLLLIGMENCK